MTRAFRRNATRRGGALLALLFLAAGLSARTRTGLDVLESEGFAPLKGKRIGLIANHTALNARGVHAADLLRRAPGVTLAAVFSPEHGFTGRIAHGRRVEDGRLPGADIPVYSLYGETRRPTPDMLRGLDALVFDVQDAGARFYTYITTLGYALEEAAKAGLAFYVLDRPNPCGGAVVEGEILDEAVRHFTAYYSIPARHGLTVGEIARLHKDRAGLNAPLTVVPLEGWRREFLWEETGLRFLPPSPNIRGPRAALLYCGVGMFEATNVSVGRGTPRPFEVFGAPWMDGEALSRRLNRLKLPGVRFKPAAFTPKSDLYAGRRCRGVRVLVTDPRAARPVDVFVQAACALRDLSPADFQPRWAEMPRMAGSDAFETLFKAGAPAQEILDRFHKSAAEFEKIRLPHLLYQ